MKAILFSMLAATVLASSSYAQRPAFNKPVAAPKAAAIPHAYEGTVSGRTYTNKTFRFDVAFPENWMIPGDDFEPTMKQKGFDLSLKAPAVLGLQNRTQLNQALKRVTVLLTAYRSAPGTADNAIVRIAVEDLKPQPQIKDAVDYFDAMRAVFAGMKLPADFKYSETNAEKLGTKQFAFLDTSDKNGKKRMYATVRDGHAILFTLSYTDDGDLQTLRTIMGEGNFSLRKE